MGIFGKKKDEQPRASAAPARTAGAAAVGGADDGRLRPGPGRAVDAPGRPGAQRAGQGRPAGRQGLPGADRRGPGEHGVQRADDAAVLARWAAARRWAARRGSTRSCTRRATSSGSAPARTAAGRRSCRRRPRTCTATTARRSSTTTSARSSAPRPSPRCRTRRYVQWINQIGADKRAAVQAGDKARFEQLERQFYDRWITTSPQAVSHRCGDPVYRQAFIDYCVAVSLIVSFDPGMQALDAELKEAVTRMVYGGGGLGMMQINPDSFWPILDVVIRQQEIANALTAAGGVRELDPDRTAGGGAQADRAVHDGAGLDALPHRGGGGGDAEPDRPAGRVQARRAGGRRRDPALRPVRSGIHRAARREGRRLQLVRAQAGRRLGRMAVQHVRRSGDAAGRFGQHDLPLLQGDGRSGSSRRRSSFRGGEPRRTWRRGGPAGRPAAPRGLPRDRRSCAAPSACPSGCAAAWSSWPPARDRR